ELDRQPLPEKSRLEHGAHGRRCALGTERQPAALLVLELVHLLRDHLGRVAGAVNEEVARLEDGRPDFAIAEAGRNPAVLALDVTPLDRFARQDVARSAHHGEFHDVVSSILPRATAFQEVRTPMATPIVSAVRSSALTNRPGTSPW